MGKKSIIRKKEGGIIIRDFIDGTRWVETDKNDAIIYRKKGVTIQKDLTGTILITNTKTGRSLFL